MTGTIKQDAEGMADTIADIVENWNKDRNALEGIDSDTVIGGWRVNIPYAKYTGKK